MCTPRAAKVRQRCARPHHTTPAQTLATPPNLRSDNGISRKPTASLSLGGRLVRTARDARILAPPPLAAAAPGSKWVPCSSRIASCACPASAKDTNALACACVLGCVRATARPPSSAAVHPCVHVCVCVSCSELAHVSSRRAGATRIPGNRPHTAVILGLEYRAKPKTLHKPHQAIHLGTATRP